MDTNGGRLAQAVELAEARKQASAGGGKGVIYTQERLVFSGFDIDYDELCEIAQRVGRLFHSAAGGMGLQPLFISTWVDGLLVGLMFAKTKAESDAAAGS